MTGLEPARRVAYAPKAYVSTIPPHQHIKTSWLSLPTFTAGLATQRSPHGRAHPNSFRLVSSNEIQNPASFALLRGGATILFPIGLTPDISQGTPGVLACADGLSLYQPTKARINFNVLFVWTMAPRRGVEPRYTD